MLRAEFEKRLGSFHLHVQLQTDGGTLGLLGASGSGKSMTLKCIAGILRPDRGHIELDGTVLFDSARGINLPPQRRRVGYLFQNYALFPNMTARQNILCALHAMPRSARAAQAQALLARFHLEDAAQLYPAQLSGGQQQRVALARILAAQPRAVLLDEPLSALDPFLRWQLELELAQLLEGFDGARLWVTHDAGECRRNCEHVCVLEQGQSDAVLPAAQLFSHPQTVAQARLIGCRSFYTLEGGAVPQLGLHVSNTHARVLGVPQAAVIPGTALHCRVLRVLDEPDGQLALLRPLTAAPDTPPLCAALRDAPDALPPRLTCGDEIAVSLHPDRLLFFQR